VLARTARN
jgi:hypothetical protein